MIHFHNKTIAWHTGENFIVQNPNAGAIKTQCEEVIFGSGKTDKYAFVLQKGKLHQFDLDTNISEILYPNHKYVFLNNTVLIDDGHELKTLNGELVLIHESEFEFFPMKKQNYNFCLKIDIKPVSANHKDFLLLKKGEKSYILDIESKRVYSVLMGSEIIWYHGHWLFIYANLNKAVHFESNEEYMIEVHDGKAEILLNGNLQFKDSDSIYLNIYELGLSVTCKKNILIVTGKILSFGNHKIMHNEDSTEICLDKNIHALEWKHEEQILIISFGLEFVKCKFRTTRKSTTICKI